MIRLIVILSVSIGLMASTAVEAAKPPANPMSRPKATLKAKRAPASVPKFICEDPETTENSQAAVLAKFLNDKCDPARTFTITMTNPGSTYPITICCVAK